MLKFSSHAVRPSFGAALPLALALACAAGPSLAQQGAPAASPAATAPVQPTSVEVLIEESFRLAEGVASPRRDIRGVPGPGKIYMEGDLGGAEAGLSLRVWTADGARLDYPIEVRASTAAGSATRVTEFSVFVPVAGDFQGAELVNERGGTVTLRRWEFHGEARNQASPAPTPAPAPTPSATPRPTPAPTPAPTPSSWNPPSGGAGQPAPAATPYPAWDASGTGEPRFDENGLLVNPAGQPAPAPIPPRWENPPPPNPDWNGQPGPNGQPDAWEGQPNPAWEGQPGQPAYGGGENWGNAPVPAPTPSFEARMGGAAPSTGYPPAPAPGYGDSLGQPAPAAGGIPPGYQPGPPLRRTLYSDGTGLRLTEGSRSRWFRLDPARRILGVEAQGHAYIWTPKARIVFNEANPPASSFPAKEFLKGQTLRFDYDGFASTVCVEVAENTLRLTRLTVVYEGDPVPLDPYAAPAPAPAAWNDPVPAPAPAPTPAPSSWRDGPDRPWRP